MHLSRIKLKNYRNYATGEASLSPETNIIIGGNGAGKTNLLEAVQFLCCGVSFRTGRCRELIREGSDFFRLEADLRSSRGSVTRRVSLSHEDKEGVRVDPGGGAHWLNEGAIFCFSPDDLQLIKGAPALRRRFMDETISRRSPAYRTSIGDYQKVLSQRNSFLQRARAGLVELSSISPWDRQLAHLAAVISAERQAFMERLGPAMGAAYSDICDDGSEPQAVYRSQLVEMAEDGEVEQRLLERLEQTWDRDLERQRTGTGTHRDDVEFLLRRKNLRSFGSQGEQRAAVLALLLAERRLALDEGEEPPVLLLDDVMSELDQDRRRRLMKTLAGPGAGQVMITAADQGLFTDAELGASTVMEICRGAILESWAETNV